MTHSPKTSEEKLLSSFEYAINCAFDKCPFEDFLTHEEIQELKDFEKRVVAKEVEKLPRKDGVRFVFDSMWLNDRIAEIKVHAKNAYHSLKEKNK